MTTPPHGEPDDTGRAGQPWGSAPSGPPASGESSAPPPEPEAPFDPYRFGAPEHPVPAEYAPPGYTPPPTYAAPTQPAPPYGSPPYGSTPGGAPWPQHGTQPSPYPGQPYGYPPPYATAYPPPRTGNGKAIAGLVLGIISIVFCFTSIIDLVPVILAVVFGTLGLNEARRGAGGRGTAIAALICAALGAILAITFTVVVLQRIRPCLDYPSGSSEYTNCIQHRL